MSWDIDQVLLLFISMACPLCTVYQRDWRRHVCSLQSPPRDPGPPELLLRHRALWLCRCPVRLSRKRHKVWVPTRVHTPWPNRAPLWISDFLCSVAGKMKIFLQKRKELNLTELKSFKLISRRLWRISEVDKLISMVNYEPANGVTFDVLNFEQTNF